MGGGGSTGGGVLGAAGKAGAVVAGAPGVLGALVMPSGGMASTAGLASVASGVDGSTGVGTGAVASGLGLGLSALSGSNLPASWGLGGKGRTGRSLRIGPM